MIFGSTEDINLPHRMAIQPLWNTIIYWSVTLHLLTGLGSLTFATTKNNTVLEDEKHHPKEGTDLQPSGKVDPPNKNVTLTKELVEAQKIFSILMNQSEKYNNDEKNRPPYTFKRLVLQALLSKPDHTMTLKQIYQFVENKYAFYRNDERKKKDYTPWKWTLKDVLSRQTKCKLFFRTPIFNVTRERGGQAGHWTYYPNLQEKVFMEAYRTGHSWFT